MSKEEAELSQPGFELLDRPPERQRIWLAAMRRRPFTDPCGVLAYSDLIAIRHERGEDVTVLLAEARGLYPRNCWLVWQEARVMTAAGRNAEAVAAFDWLLAGGSRTPLSQA